MTIECTPERKVFPSDKADELDFMVCTYRATDSSVLPEWCTSPIFKAKGVMLPYTRGASVCLEGSTWDTSKDEPTFCVESSRWNMPDTKESLFRFLMDLDGCDKECAARIVNLSMTNAPMSNLDIDMEPFEKAIKSPSLAKKVSEAYAIRRAKRDEFFFLLSRASKDVSPSVCATAAVAAPSVADLQMHSLRYCIEGLLPYTLAKKIAKEFGVSYQSLEGIKAAVIDVLKQSEGSSTTRIYGEDTPSGNTYCPVQTCRLKTANMVGLLESDPKIMAAIKGVIDDGYCVAVKGKYLYRAATCDAEYGIAEEVIRLLDYKPVQRDYKDDIYCLENIKHIRLAPEQRNAVKVSLSNAVTLLIGGPGTGKTTIEQVIIEVYKKYNKDNVLLVAPTGKAARRMSESCGLPASTVHKALGVSAGPEVLKSATVLDAGLILVDEASMLDAQTCFALFKAIKAGTQVVIVGDTNQLPSVGAGNVLYELIESHVVPIAQLETVYRQKAGSTIAVNCARIKRGATNLEYSDTFVLEIATSQEDAVEKVMAAYDEELARGLTADDICLLSPYRRSTPTGVNQMNPILQKKFIAPETASISYGRKKFFLGDKVMCMTNGDDVANGDTGYITEIKGGRFTVDFGDGRTVEYAKSALRNFDLAYAISIHKSQGAEFKTCIIVLMDEHASMLKRNLIYTAVSRAKQKVFLISTVNALETAIQTEDVTRRLSLLGTILQENMPTKIS